MSRPDWLRHLSSRHDTRHALLLGALALAAACGESTTSTVRQAAPSDALMARSGGNSLNAKSCQKNGWKGLVTSTGAAFASEEACVSYAAQGGTLYQGQTITFAALPGKTFGDADFAVAATASSGLAVTFTAIGNCTVTGNSVHLTGAGSCTVTAHQAGDATWFAAPDVAQSFAIAKGTQTITFAALGGKSFGDADFNVSASASSSLSVAFGAAGGCTITGNSVHITGAGLCTITASQAGDANWNAAADVPQSFTTALANQTISFTSANPSPANVGSTYTPTASATSGLAVAITLDGTSTGCSLASGVVSFTSAGTCVVNANQAGNTNYNAATQVQQSITTQVPCISTEASLRAAAAAGGTYNFCAQGTTILLTGGQVTVATTLALSAVGTGNAVINGQAASRVFNVASGQLTLTNVTVTNGRESTSGVGGGIRVKGILVLNGNSAVIGNTAPNGAGIFIDNSGSSATLNDAATVSNNVSAQNGSGWPVGGGGVHVEYFSAFTMNGTSSVSGNTTTGPGSGGGGILSNSATITLNGSASITSNQAAGQLLGGGIYFVNSGSLTLSSSARITGNNASNGGGILRWDGGAGTITGVTAANVTGNTPNNCASGNVQTPAVPGCVP